MATPWDAYRGRAERRGSPVTAHPRSGGREAGKPNQSSTATPAHPRGGKPEGEPGETRYDPNSAIQELLAGIAGEYDAAIADARGSYGGGGGGGGGGADYSDAIREAEEMLADVIANRAALGAVYEEYGTITDPESQAAIEAAAGIVAAGQPRLDQIAAQEERGVERSYNQAEAAILEMAALIGAAETAPSVREETTETEALRLEGALQEAGTASRVLGLTQSAATAQAKADRDLDEGDFERRSGLVDMEFEQMEEDVRDQIKQLREAQAAAAAAASARRRAGASAYASELAMLEEERFQALQINPHEAGEATALNYLSQHASGLDYNRQQLVLSTVSNAISQQVAPSQVDRWLQQSEVSLRSDERGLVRGAVSAYVAGMRHQQGRDQEFRATSPADNRNPVVVPTGQAPPPRRQSGGPQ